MPVWPLKGPQGWASEGIGSQMARTEFAYCFRVGFNVPVAWLVCTLHLLDIIQSWVILNLWQTQQRTSVETSGSDAVTLVSCCHASQHSSDHSLLLSMCQARSLRVSLSATLMYWGPVSGSAAVGTLWPLLGLLRTDQSYTPVKDIYRVRQKNLMIFKLK
jgi:hypothetical protein